MIATTHANESIKFWSLFSGELKHVYSSSKQASFTNAFLIKEKNALGVIDWRRKVIEIIQLHPEGN